ncbi:ribosome maturation protein [Phaeosphaeriaceae sp. PMI808]|nr:ribosome maturation protein [Phaeosphaeriaceae sp. PMI808]
MPRGNVGTTKVFYQGSSEGFAVFVESEEIVKKWRGDKTIPLTDVVAGWKIFTTEHGKQGVLNTASNSQLENEFGTKNEDDVVKKILEKGDVQTSENPERQGNTNDSKGAMLSH